MKNAEKKKNIQGSLRLQGWGWRKGQEKKVKNKGGKVFKKSNKVSFNY